MRGKRFLLLTLANGRKPVIIPPDNISFAMAMEDKNIVFTRVFLKVMQIDDDAKWVDVVETPEDIYRRK